MNNVNTKAAMSMFRPLLHAKESNSKQDTTVADLSSASAEFVENKSAITIALEDFTQKLNSLHGEEKSNITAQDAKGSIFSKLKSKIGNSRENIFETYKGQKYLNENENLFQDDIYNQENIKNGGIRYAKNEDDIYKSALNFAKAEFGAIEKANTMVNSEYNSNNKLDYWDVKSYNNSDKDFNKILQTLDIDGKSGLNTREYASYIMAFDTASQYCDPSVLAGFGAISPDGVISSSDVQVAKEMDLDEIIRRAIAITVNNPLSLIGLFLFLCNLKGNNSEY